VLPVLGYLSREEASVFTYTDRIRIRIISPFGREQPMRI
jgi:hypothetical protein